MNPVWAKTSGQSSIFLPLFLAGAKFVADASDPHCISRLCGAVIRAAADAVCQSQDDEPLRIRLSGLGIVAESAPTITAFRLAERYSCLTDAPVLITGETGTGKELVARAIHGFDAHRSRHRFLAINSAALNKETALSELFGHKRGAYTGADQDRLGLFRAAEGGVLFLDEIGDLSLDLQAKVLRVIQEKRLIRLGDEHEFGLDVRIIAATNRDLKEMTRRGEFRQDLYYRLNVLSVRVPPLRERREDILPLINHFLNKHTDRSEWAGVGCAPEFIEALQRSILPGNVRQLEAVLLQALLSLERPRPLELGDLPAEIWTELAQANIVQEIEATGAGSDTSDLASHALKCLMRHDWNLGVSLQSMEAVLIAAALEACDGSQAKAALRLGISPRSIYNKLRRPNLAG